MNAVNDAPAFTSPAIFAVAENSTTIGTVTATDIEGNPVSFAIAGGADQALFAIDPSGALRFISAPDFETPQDANRDNVYDLVVSATDNLGAVSTQTLAVAVANIAEQGSAAFRIALDGAQQVPALTSSATGLGTAIFDGATSSMSIDQRPGPRLGAVGRPGIADPKPARQRQRRGHPQRAARQQPPRARLGRPRRRR